MRRTGQHSEFLSGKHSGLMLVIYCVIRAAGYTSTAEDKALHLVFNPLLLHSPCAVCFSRNTCLHITSNITHQIEKLKGFYWFSFYSAVYNFKSLCFSPLKLLQMYPPNGLYCPCMQRWIEPVSHRAHPRITAAGFQQNIRVLIYLFFK